jgi:hypothetical protein
VWYCSGQSNMWLPMGFSYSRNYTAANISSGKFSNIRLMAGDSQHANAWPWATAKDAVNATHMETSKLFQFSAACWYFAEALTLEFEAAGKTPPTLGLVNTAIGGSMIEGKLGRLFLSVFDHDVSMSPTKSAFFRCLSCAQRATAVVICYITWF